MLTGARGPMRARAQKRQLLGMMSGRAALCVRRPGRMVRDRACAGPGAPEQLLTEPLPPRTPTAPRPPSRASLAARRRARQCRWRRRTSLVRSTVCPSSCPPATSTRPTSRLSARRKRPSRSQTSPSSRRSRPSRSPRRPTTSPTSSRSVSDSSTRPTISRARAACKWRRRLRSVSDSMPC
ncbi:hypothetical protein T492DRAFT_1057017 [Pavlovales sp. CCMP2436]|nr:hypothetical protein T492DRAFT_1057017 [Pavlovales sp. CCMP2436]